MRVKKTNQPPRPVIADLIRNPEGQGVRGDNKTAQPYPDRHSRVPNRHSRVGGNPQGGRVAVILASRQYPQGEVTTSQHQPTPRPVILDCTRHSRVGGNPQGGCVVPGTVILALRQYDGGMFMDSDWFGYVWLLRVARVQSVTGAGVLISPSAPSVRHWDRLCSCRQGRGVLVGVVLFTGVTLLPLWIADQVRNDGAGVGRVMCFMSSSSSHVCMLSFCVVDVRSI